MLYFTKYADQKFEILNRHKVYFTREQIEEAVKLPDSNGRRGRYFWVEKDGLRVILRREGEVEKVLTFFPVK